MTALLFAFLAADTVLIVGLVLKCCRLTDERDDANAMAETMEIRAACAEMTLAELKRVYR